jgi:metal-sulfur cluster biosynthetic enzyme
MVTQQEILEGLREVVDPELGASLVDLGMIQEVLVEEDRIHVKMVLTIPGCPLAGYLLAKVREKVEGLAQGAQVNVELVNEPWKPPWSRAEE